ncbi:MAG: tetratricopeptide repeat protein [Desulfobacterales bacterium]|nr:tetratricopeptide repeat protein [Desulfobacterales bacterium]
MIRRLWLVFILFSISFLQPTLLLAEEVILRSDDQFRFAVQAMDKGEYPRAVVEFERFVYFFPRDEKVPKARLLIGVCYLRAKTHDPARKALEDVFNSYSDSLTGGKALLLIGESYYRQGVSNEAERYYKIVIEKYPHKELSNAALYRLGWSQMQSFRWRDASKSFETVEASSPLYASSQELIAKSLDGEALPYKDPTTAGVMAGILPGLGHAYCNRYRDGAVAFLLNGLFIWAAVESFNEGHDVLGGILTVLELGWYSGNIYSAANAAHKHNRKIRNDFLQGLPDALNLNLLLTREGHIGLALRVNF